jgi:predicted nucleotidyltransferase
MDTIIIPAEFEKILTLLHHAKIEYVLVGGLAMILHGCDHITNDVDISVALDAENAEKVCDWFMAHHARPPLFNPLVEFDLTPQKLAKFRFVNLQTDLGPIDILPVPAGVESYVGLWERGKNISMGDFTVRIASINDLIAMKKAANRPKDQTHIMELQALKKIIEEKK